MFNKRPISNKKANLTLCKIKTVESNNDILYAIIPIVIIFYIIAFSIGGNNV